MSVLSNLSIKRVEELLNQRFSVRHTVYSDGTHVLIDVRTYPPTRLTPRCYEEELEHFCENSFSQYETFVTGQKKKQPFTPFWSDE